MITIRPAEERGRTKIDWLDSRHTFSFNRYYDRKHMNYRALRVINDDFVAPAGRFGSHPHENMEILTYVLDGVVVHQDSTGAKGETRPGDIQRMTAGSGIFHSEANGSYTDALRFLQIWIYPEQENLEPGYEQKSFAPEERANRLRLIASRDARDGSVRIHQDADVFSGVLSAGASVTHELRPGRGAWLQVAKGEVTLNGKLLKEGDGAAIEGETTLTIQASAPSDLLLFDLA